MDKAIQWYPGHMTRAVRRIKDELKLVDVVIELLDARIPLSSKNPDIDGLAQNKQRICILNKSDLACERATAQWKARYEALGFAVVIANAHKAQGLDNIRRLAIELMSDKIQRQKARGRLVVPIRGMVCGIPNVGKSTMINRFAKNSKLKVEDRPGVTRDKQWIKIANDFELLDTPGILWPRFDSPDIGLNLAMTGAINDNILEREELAKAVIKKYIAYNPEGLRARFNIDPGGDIDDIFIDIARGRGFILSQGRPHIAKTAAIILDEFRAGKFGRITLDTCSNNNQNHNDGG